MKLPENMTLGVKGLVTTGMLALLVGCGGGGSSSSDGSSPTLESVVSRGVITQLGSIWVNGCRYEETAGGTYKNDDNDSASFNDYQVGMNVSIRGSKQPGGTECEADEVEYEAEIEGQLSGGKIHGVTILQTPATNGPTMTSGSRYKVSGVWVHDSTLEATYVTDDNDLEDEIKGSVQAVDSGVSFEVKEITFNYTGSTVVAVGNLVEVHFSPPCSGTYPDVVCNATEVELEDDFFENAEGLEVEVEGPVNLTPGNCPPAADIEVDGVCVDSSTAEWTDGLASRDDLVDGSRVEAEGHMIAATPRDYMRADEIKGRGNRVRISSFAEMKSGTANDFSFKLVDQEIDVNVVSGVTELEEGVTFDNIDAANHRLEVRGLRTGANSMLAIRVKLEDNNDDKLDEHEVRAEVDVNGADESGPTISVMGIVSSANGSTQLQQDDNIPYTGTLAQFLADIDDNEDAADGPRDIVEVRIDSSAGFYAEQIEIEHEDD